MNFGSVCSGIEAASVAWHPLGWRAAWLAEIEPFPRAVLAHHYPTVPNLGDMTTIARRVLSGEVEAPDLLCGGTPCQAFSVAGLRESLADERGNLTLKYVELANAIDHVRLRAGKPAAIDFWENVPGVLSTKDNAFGCFLAGLAGEDEPLQPPGGKWANAGAVYGPARTVAWRTLDAQYFGVAQRRRRVFVVASARNDFDPASVLFEWDGLRRDSAPSREAGKVAPTIPARSLGGGGLGTDFDCDGGLIQAFGGNNQSGPIDVATARNACASASASGRMDFETETFLVQPTHTLRGEGFDASEDGTGRGTPLVPVVEPWPGFARDLHLIQSTRPLAFDTSQANRSNPQPGDPCHPLAAEAHAPAIAFPANLSGTQCASTENLAPAMGAKNPTAVAFFQGERDGRMDGGTPQSQDDLPTGGVRGVRRCGCGGAPQERGLEGSQAREPAAPLPELPHEGAQVGRQVPAVRETAQGPGLLRDALPEAEAPRRPGIQADATCLQCGGVLGSEPLDGALREARAAVQARDAGKAADDKERSRAHPMAVRRLTPVECERLQGFPDNYTAIPWRTYQEAQRKGISYETLLSQRGMTLRGPSIEDCPDGPRYKALGNSWAVPVAAWLGRRIQAAVEQAQRRAA